MAKNVAESNGENTKAHFDKKVQPHFIKLDDLLIYEDFHPTGKNLKLTPKWAGLAKFK
jgi:hypothetical protein